MNGKAKGNATFGFELRSVFSSTNSGGGPERENGTSKGTERFTFDEHLCHSWY
jgi:hypothetical protein